ncbi:putative F-box/FBD/LRR-repeat protein At1g78760 isoform X1 [Papaver somniferum]|uniref:putative F-box/FBD/LRR-repeat protein At1g78760 isoform X1 n=1 Tax=Papaver somniferum TaxID=3469 RepID=UPI000E700115|nr:putative F-box/FBD/LRR-repeat protein At1g78760 isoform X1 [Papaver somniferum]
MSAYLIIISFPKLKSLETEGVEFSNEYWNEKLFSNCPVLEDFRIEHCTWFGMPNFCISTPALKHLKIDNWDDGLRGCTLKVHAPNLETLYYNGSVAKEYVLTAFPLLVRAAVQFRFKPYVATRKQRISHGAAISQFLRALANIKHLFVSDGTLQAISFAVDLLEKLPTLRNTKELIMFEEVTAHKTLIALLKATPNLKLLVFNKTEPPISDDEEEDYVVDDDADAAEGEDNHGSEDDVAGSDADAAEGEDDDWTRDVGADSGSLFPHLKSVYFKEFIGNPMEMEWMKLILMNAKALRTMSISSCAHSYLLNTKKKEELMAHISSLPRASTSCVVEFPSW